MLTTHLFLLLCLTLFELSSASSPCPQANACIKNLNAGQSCALFPMVPGTFDPPLASKPFVLTKLRPGVHHYSDDAYHALILYSRATNNLAVIDFPRSPNSIAPDGTYLLITAVNHVLRGQVPKTVHMVYSHRHFDHIGNADIFKAFLDDAFPTANLHIWATRETKRFILRKETTDVPLPNAIIRKRMRTIWLSKSLQVQLLILGGHTGSDVLAYVPRARFAKGVIHYPDVVTSGEVPFIQFTLTIDLGRYLEVHKKLLSLDFDFFSTGHGRIGNKDDVKTNMKYTEFVIQAARNAARDADPAQIAGINARIADISDPAYRNGAWALKSVLDIFVKACTKAVIQRWACRLSAVDVFAEGHCLSAVAYNFLDQ